jgi:hypothetical protein
MMKCLRVSRRRHANQRLAGIVFRRSGPTTLRMVIFAVILAVCSASGLAAGTFARGHVGDTPDTTTGPNGYTQPTPSAAPATPTPTDTPAATVVPTSAFQVGTSIAPSHIVAGGTLTVVAHVASKKGHMPLANVQCFMRAPHDGSAPLFSLWPAAAITNENGDAMWQLVAPQVAPGTYGVEVVAYGASGYYYYGDAQVTIGA